MNPVIWFEIPGKDRARLTEFYKKAFGWEILPPMGTSPDAYIVAHTTETDKAGMPKRSNVINGGFYQLTAKNADCANQPNIMLSTDDIQKSMKAITAAGGKVLGEPVDIPNVGRYVCFLDPEGTRSAIMQPAM